MHKSFTVCHSWWFTCGLQLEQLTDKCRRVTVRQTLASTRLFRCWFPLKPALILCLAFVFCFFGLRVHVPGLLFRSSQRVSLETAMAVILAARFAGRRLHPDVVRRVCAFVNAHWRTTCMSLPCQRNSSPETAAGAGRRAVWKRMRMTVVLWPCCCRSTLRAMAHLLVVCCLLKSRAMLDRSSRVCQLA
jgi:hypothetical protein